MAFFISDPLSALGSDISAQESVGSKVDEYHILGTRQHFWKLINCNVIPITDSPEIRVRYILKL